MFFHMPDYFIYHHIEKQTWVLKFSKYFITSYSHNIHYIKSGLKNTIFNKKKSLIK